MTNVTNNNLFLQEILSLSVNIPSPSLSVRAPGCSALGQVMSQPMAPVGRKSETGKACRPGIEFCGDMPNCRDPCIYKYIMLSRGNSLTSSPVVTRGGAEPEAGLAVIVSGKDSIYLISFCDIGFTFWNILFSV